MKIIDDEGNELALEKLDLTFETVLILKPTSDSRMPSIQVETIYRKLVNDCKEKGLPIPAIIVLPTGLELHIKSMYEIIGSWSKILQDAQRKAMAVATAKTNGDIPPVDIHEPNISGGENPKSGIILPFKND